MNKKRMVGILAGFMAAVLLLGLLFSLIPVQADAVTSDKLEELEEQIKKLKEETQK